MSRITPERELEIRTLLDRFPSSSAIQWPRLLADALRILDQEREETRGLGDLLHRLSWEPQLRYCKSVRDQLRAIAARLRTPPAFARHRFDGLPILIKARRGPRSLRDVAGEAGVSFATLSRVEGGHPPDLETLLALCKWIGITPNDALGWTTYPEPPDLAALAQAALDAQHRLDENAWKGDITCPERWKDDAAKAEQSRTALFEALASTTPPFPAVPDSPPAEAVELAAGYSLGARA